MVTRSTTFVFLLILCLIWEVLRGQLPLFTALLVSNVMSHFSWQSVYVFNNTPVFFQRVKSDRTPPQTS